jgi:hypothetical protein
MDVQHTRHRLTAVVILLFLWLLVAACRSQGPSMVSTATALPTTEAEELPDQPAVTEATDPAYPPPPPATAAGGPYPPPSPTFTIRDAYPATEEEPPGILLALERPVHSGDTTIRGVGPAGITVFVRNITQMGADIGQATIASDGTFTIQATSLQANTRIGVTTTASVPEGIRPGEGALNVPQVGYFYDTVLVRP